MLTLTEQALKEDLEEAWRSGYDCAVAVIDDIGKESADPDVRKNAIILALALRAVRPQ